MPNRTQEYHSFRGASHSVARLNTQVATVGEYVTSRLANCIRQIRSKYNPKSFEAGLPCPANEP